MTVFKLGQYSFVESYGKSSILSNKLFSRVGLNGGFTVPLSYQVKQAIVASLIPHVQQDEALPLSPGTNTIAKHQLYAMGSSSSRNSDAHVILVWHIATRFCDSQIIQRFDVYDDDDFVVASQLSDYCAYLLAFSPELLLDDAHSTECLFDNAVHQALDLKMQGLNVGQMYQRLFHLEVNDNIVVEGDVLARELINRNIRNVLAEFWVELLLYLAPSDNVEAHIEYLAREGEFITHLWALLTHAGTVER